MKYGGIAREIPILQYPCAAASTVVYGMLIEFTGGVAIAWAGTNPLFGVATGDADLDALVLPVYVAKGHTVFIKCGAGVVPTVGQELFWIAGGLAQVTGTAGTGFGIAVKAGLNGMVEARLK